MCRIAFRYKNQREREREINSEKKKIRDEMARAERLKDEVDRKLEKMSIRSSCLGVDRNSRAYMFFPGRDHRIFVQYLEDRTSAEVWGAYTQPQQLDGLLASLDQRGCRDAALYEALCVNYSRISQAQAKVMRNAQDSLKKQEAEPEDVRRSTRTKVMQQQQLHHHQQQQRQQQHVAVIITRAQVPIARSSSGSLLPHFMLVRM